MTSLSSYSSDAKYRLRNKSRYKRSLLSVKQQLIYSYQAFELLIKLPEVLAYQNIAAYIAFDKELALGNAINWLWANNKNCCLPTVCSTKNRKMVFVNYAQHTKLYYNKFGIFEPKQNTSTIAIENIDVILLPLTCFDKNCNRIGMGQGYYDRALDNVTENNKPILIGMAYDFQKVDVVPTNNFDIPLDIIVTDKCYYFKTS